MNIAAAAREAALPIEVKKDGLSQLQDGSWVLKLKVHPAHIPAALLTAPMGTRYMAALVEIGDDETPVSPEQQATREKPAKDRKRWSELPPSQQAAIRCNDGTFWKFIENIHKRECFGDADAAAFVRDYCGVTTRAVLNDYPEPWHRLDADYRFWLQHQEE